MANQQKRREGHLGGCLESRKTYKTISHYVVLDGISLTRKLMVGHVNFVKTKQKKEIVSVLKDGAE